jgi:hypothetical protein
MPSIKHAAGEFLASRRIAVTGVSRKPESHGSNVVYKRLRERGYEVFAVNPNADQVEGEHGITVIDGGCPCMFDPTADVGHKAMRLVFTLNRHVPRQVA